MRLRSGKNLDDPYGQSLNDKNVEIKNEKKSRDEEGNSSDEEKSIQSETLEIPFLEALKDKKKKIVRDTQAIEDILKNVVIEIPLFKTLEQIPSYAKFMKKEM